ncbi:MAG TPA: SHOCT domain-containing protein [Spirochaetia bacterium]|nr:SHOCT domain-containing protein [Spirochaetia bacterium]
MGGWGNGGYGGWAHPFLWAGPIVMVLFWIGVIVAIVFAVRFFIRQRRQEGKEDSALEILKKRYARGEISKEEYQEKHKALR